MEHSIGGTTRLAILALFLGSALGGTARADVELPAVLGSRMVLQQRTEVAFWGRAEPGESVSVSASWGGAAPSTRAGEDGRWRVMLATPEAGGPHSITVRGRNAITLEDVLVGEVWLCGGQSNMEWAFAYGGVKDGAAERAAANDPQVRLFDVPNVVSAAPLHDCEASWAACTPDSVNGFSCAGWFFARELRRELGVPIGLIGVNWGGTVAQAWMSRESLAPFPRFRDELARVAAEAGDPEGAERRLRAGWESWWQELEQKELGARNGWATRDFDDSGWESRALPGLWDGELAGFDGIGWYRRAIELPPALAGRELVLTLGPLDDMDSLFLDGEKIAGTEIHGRWNRPRRYVVPARLATAGRHVLALRVVDTGGGGGMTGEAGDLALFAEGSAARVELAGGWRFRTSLAGADVPALPQVRPALHANVATALSNGMVAAIEPFGIRGALWYQGESNRGHAAEYADLMPALIADWRARFERPGFPFFFVQIAPFGYDGSRAATAELRQAQLETLRVENTGMVVTTDIGDAGNIHPADKQEVGRRLALWALAENYGRGGIEPSGPLFESMSVEGGSVRVRFTHATGGLFARGGPLTDFEIRGDGEWVAASAEIDGDTVVVRSDAVRAPKEVRFGFADACAPNLFNGAGLPASPFCRIER